MPSSVLIVGTLALDDIETLSAKRTDIVGGAAYYAAMAATLFAPVNLVGVIGDDFPKNALEMLSARGVDLAGVETVPGRQSFHWSGKYHLDMNTRDTLDTRLNVLADFNPVLPDSYRYTPYLFLANITPALQLAVLEQMAVEAFVACDTMNYWIETARDDLVKVLQRVNLVLMNDAEVRQFAGEPNLNRAAQDILALGPQYLIIKMGEYGATLVSRDTRFTLPCCPLPDVQDPTGAGDSFAGGLMGYLASADSHSEPHLRIALAVGTITASRCCESFGAEALLQTTPHQVRRRYEQLRAATSFAEIPQDICRHNGNF
jgi:sugar/nucleoside kinase (ribokinase family)